jgi:hypothetical protein
MSPETTHHDAEPSPATDAAIPKLTAPPGLLERLLRRLVDPKIQRNLLTLGGVLFVIGLVIALASSGLFDEPRVAAAGLGLLSGALLGSGAWVVTRTRHNMAGQALTFLGCVVLPLNLWYSAYQGLVAVDQHLWVGGVVCVGVYAAIVWLLRRPLFLYAVELGVTLTVMLLLAQCQVVTNTTWIGWALLLAGLVSMMAQAIFPDDDAQEFSRKRYGVPLFAAGHVQLAVGLAAVGIGHLLFGGVFSKVTGHYGMTAENSIAWYAGAWALGAVAYLSSAIVTRRRAFVAPAIGCVVATACELFRLTVWSTSTRTLVVEGAGLTMLITAWLVSLGNTRRDNDRRSLAADILGNDGLGIAGLWITALSGVALGLQGLARLSGPKVEFIDGILPTVIGAGMLALASTVAAAGQRRILGVLSGALGGLAGITFAMHSQISFARKAELATALAGMAILATGLVRRVQEDDGREYAETPMLLWFGSFLVAVPLLAFGLASLFGTSIAVSLDKAVLLVALMVMLVAGAVLQTRGPVIVGGTALAVYLVAMIGNLLWVADLSAGIYLTVGGGAIFALALGLSFAQDWLMALPTRAQERRGLFAVLNWR